MTYDNLKSANQRIKELEDKIRETVKPSHGDEDEWCAFKGNHGVMCLGHVEMVQRMSKLESFIREVK